MKRTLRCCCLGAVVAAMAGCGLEPAPVPRVDAAESLGSPPPRASSARRVPIEIVSVTPESIQVRGGRAVADDFLIEYRIANPEKVDKAEVRVHARGLSDISRYELPVRAEGTFSLRVEPGAFDFGPTVRFRASCPEGVTDWFTLGSPPVPYDDRMAPGLKIGSVTPESIGFDRNPDSGGAVRIGIWGLELTPECTAEGEIDGRPLPLHNTFAKPKQITALVKFSDLDGRAISARYLEIKVSIRGPGLGQVAIQRIPFVE